MAMRDPIGFLGRKNPDYKFRVVSKFPARLKSHNRVVPVTREEVLPPDNPQSKFITR